MRTPRRATVVEQVDRWSVRHSDHRPERNPKTMAFLAGATYNAGPVATGLYALPGFPGTPTLYTQISAAGVALGCLLCLLGLLWPKRDIGLGIEIAGCIILGVGASFYSQIVGIVPSQTVLAIAIGVGALLRAAQIALYIHGRRLRAEQETRKATT